MSKATIQSLIEQVRNETQLHGNTRQRIASLLTQLNSEKLDRPAVEGIISEITNLSPLFFDQFGNILSSLTQGWTLQYSDEEFVDGTETKIIRKVIGYVGGTGSLPTELSDNIGKYFAKAGGFTLIKADASDFKGISGKGAYQSYLSTTIDNPKKSEAEWVANILGDLNIKNLKGVNNTVIVKISDYASCTWRAHAYIDPQGAEINYAGFSLSKNYIPISGALNYSFKSIGYAIAFYNVNKVFITLKGDPNDGSLNLKTYSAPQNAKFCRVNLSNALLQNFELFEGVASISFKIPDLIVQADQIEGFLTTDKYSYTKPLFLGVTQNINLSAYPINGNIIVSGDSTIAKYLGGSALNDLLIATGVKTNIAAPGHTIHQQLAQWNALGAGLKTAANFIFLQIGLNDVGFGADMADVISKYQAYLNKIKANAPDAKILAGLMLPCKQRWVDVFGAVNGLTAQKNWETLNYFIKNKQFLNIDTVAENHVYNLADDNGNLAAIFNTGDNIHENTLGRKIIAHSWLSA